MSALLPDGLLMTPTNSCLGSLNPERIAKVAPDGTHISGDPPSKELFLHRALYGERSSARAVVHLHSPCAVAVSCLVDVDPENAVPPITPYFVMRIGRLPLIPYFPPGDRALAEAVRLRSGEHHAMLLANHGVVVAGTSLEDAVYNAEELEETAKLFLLLEGKKTRFLNAEQVAQLRAGKSGA
jgi:ribulose-5-phosphate 4-epimerase/fuculose-1-phosphate aldolase